VPVFRNINIPHNVRKIDSGDSGLISVVDERPQRIREQAEGICQNESLRKCVKTVTWQPNVRALPPTTLEFALEDGQKVDRPYNLVMHRFMKEIMHKYLRNCPNLFRVNIMHYHSRVDDHPAFDELRPANHLMYLPLFEAYSDQLKVVDGYLMTEGDLTIDRQYSAAETARMSKWVSVEKLHLQFRAPDPGMAYEASKIAWTLQHLPNLTHFGIRFQAGPGSHPGLGLGAYVQISNITDWTSLCLPRLKSLKLGGVYITAELLQHLLLHNGGKLQRVHLEDVWLRDGKWSEIFDRLDELGVRAARITIIGYQDDSGRPYAPPNVMTEEDRNSWHKLWENTNDRRHRLGLRPLQDVKEGDMPPEISPSDHSRISFWWLQRVPDW
jgi:hypothetical protein